MDPEYSFVPMDEGGGDQRRSGWGKCGGRGRRVEDSRRRRRRDPWIRPGWWASDAGKRERRKVGGLAAGRGGLGNERYTGLVP